MDQVEDMLGQGIPVDRILRQAEQAAQKIVESEIVAAMNAIAEAGNEIDAKQEFKKLRTQASAEEAAA